MVATSVKLFLLGWEGTAGWGRIVAGFIAPSLPGNRADFLRAGQAEALRLNRGGGPRGDPPEFLAIQIEAYVMTTKSRYFTTRVLAGMAALMLSSAVTGDESDQWNFKPIDKNGDGLLNKEEVRGTRLQKHWDTLDTNTDGQITRSEFSSFMDGNVSKEELEAAKKSHGEPTKPAESWFTSPQHDTSKEDE